MHIVVAGSGGTGGYFGAKLARAGHRVTFLARGAHLAALRAHGLTVRSAVEGQWRVDAHAVDSLRGSPAADLVLFCVKSYDTEAAAELVKPVMGPETSLLSLQNGIDNEDRLARLLGADAVLGAVAYVFANIAAPGVIAHHQFGRIILGELSGGVSARAGRIAGVLTDAGIDATAEADVRAALWRKYLFLVPLSGTTALTRLPVAFMRRFEATRGLWQRQLDELLAVAAAGGAGVGPDDAGRCVELMDSLEAGSYSSMYHDLAAGKRLELDTLHGHAVDLGRRHGVATPTLCAVYAALRPYRDGPPGSLD